MENCETPKEANAVLSVERLDLPVQVAHWVLEEAGNVLERSPPLRLVTRLLCHIYELAEVAISVFSQSSNHIE